MDLQSNYLLFASERLRAESAQVGCVADGCKHMELI